MGNCPMAHETQTGVLNQLRRVGWGSRWEGGSKGRGYMYAYGWFMLRCDRKQQNSIKQLSFNKNKFFKKAFDVSGYYKITGMQLGKSSKNLGKFAIPFIAMHL